MMKRAGWIVLLLLLWPAGAWANHTAADSVEAYLYRDAVLVEDMSGWVQDMALTYTEELRAGSRRQAVYWSPAAEAGPAGTEARRDQARQLVGAAFRSVLRNKLDDVKLFHDLRIYANRLTSAQLRVSSDDVRMSGPSLGPHPAAADSSVVSEPSFLSIRSGMGLVGNSRLGLTLTAQMADMDSQLLYDPWGGGNWQLSVGRSVSVHPALRMAYSVRFTQDQDLMGLLTFGF